MGRGRLARLAEKLAIAFLLVAAAAAAKPHPGGGGPVNVPEFDANLIGLALAACGGVLIALYGRNHRKGR